MPDHLPNRTVERAPGRGVVHSPVRPLTAMNRIKASPFSRWTAAPLLGLLFFVAPAPAETWQEALSAMPVRTAPSELTWTNCTSVLLSAFQSNATVKALIFMPGALDEFYFFRRVKVTLTNRQPTLLEALASLTNLNPVQITFRPPMLLVHVQRDHLEPRFVIEHDATASALKEGSPVGHCLYNDRDWDFVARHLKSRLPVALEPALQSADSSHFYRHTFAAWNLSPWETCEAAALAGKTHFTVTRKKVGFRSESDRTLKPERQ